MSETVKRIIIISVIVVINIILISLVVNSMKTYIHKIENGDIIETNETQEEEEELDLLAQIYTQLKEMNLDSILKIIILFIGVILMILTIIIFIRIR